MSPVVEILYKQALQLKPQELAELVSQLSQIPAPPVNVPKPEPDENTWDGAELAELMRHEPRSTKSIIEDGLFGSIPDFTDGKDTVEWIMEQKQKRLEKYQR